MKDKRSSRPSRSPGSYPIDGIDLRLSAAAELLVRVAIRMTEMASDENAEVPNNTEEESDLDLLGGV